MISSPGVYVLTQDISGSSTCITIESSDVVFDGQGYTIDGPDTGTNYGVYVYNVSAALTNVTVKNLVATDWYYGIYYRTAQNGSIDNNTANSNNYYGIYLDSSSSNTLSNNTANSNSVVGIYLISSSSNTLSNNTANSNDYGIYLHYSSDSNTLSNNTANSNNQYGIYLSSSSSNNIYNNFFNNTNNSYFGGTIYANDWNTTVSTGPNIVGGPYIGGNFWAYPNGTGFSETCTDDGGDGFCDSYYNLTSWNVDYLPLTTAAAECRVISSPGTYRLSGNILNSPAAKCIEISSSDVVFDGAGYTISGTDTSSTYGVYVYNSSTALTNVTVKNLNVTDWGTGIYYKNAQNGSIDNNTASSNTYGIYLSSSSSNTLSNNNASNNENGIYLSSSSSNTLTNNTANSNTQYGIVLSSSSSNTLTNNTANSNNYEGIYLRTNSNNNTLTNNTANSNTQYGIFLSSSSSNNLTDNTANLNSVGGIFLFSSSSNTLTNNTANSNGRGIFLWSSSSNTLSNNTANSNTQYGIYLYSSSNSNTLTNNTANSNNQYGIFLSYSSDSNTLTNNTANSNTQYGIYLASSSSNTIYNNLFNNTNNAGFGGTNTNDWNTTNSTGPNIVGGPYLGGNFWATPDGTGFSETCTDADWDGFCDTDYSLTSGNVDYLPLSLNFTGSGGGGGSIDACTTITSPGVYVLNTSISSSSTCITIESSDVVFDGAGYTINGPDLGTNYGVYVYNSTALTNVTVKNLVVTDWQTGIYYGDTQNGSIANNNASLNTQYGILLSSSSSNTLTNNNANLNNSYGIVLSSSSSNTLTNNNANLNTNYGIYLSFSSNNTLTNNNANLNTNYGIVLSSSSNNTLTNNNANSNTNYGIVLYYSSNGNTLTNNTMKGNNWDFYSGGSSSNTIITNHFTDTTASFTYAGDIKVNSSSAPAGDPSGYSNAGKYLNITNASAVAWVYLNISYTLSDIAGINESSLLMLRHNGTNWSNVSGSNVNTADRYVYANLTNFSVFAPMGQLDTTPPKIENVSVSVTQNSAVITWDTDESANSLVRYDTTSGNYSSSNYSSSLVKNHNITLTGLAAGTTYYYVVNSTDAAGNSNQSDEGIFTTQNAPSAPSSGGRGGGGGGGGGGAATSFETRIKNVLAGETIELDINDDDLPYINGLSLTAKQNIYSSRLAITDLKKKPWSSMKDPDATVFRYFKVKYDKKNYVESAKFKVSVNKSWLKDNDIDPYKFSLYRYTNAWEELDAKILKEDSEEIYFEVTTPGFSYFSLGGVSSSGYREIKEEAVSVPIEEETIEPPRIETPPPAPPVETPEPEPVKAPEEKNGICGPTAVVLLAVLPLVFRRRRTVS